MRKLFLFIAAALVSTSMWAALTVPTETLTLPEFPETGWAKELTPNVIDTTNNWYILSPFEIYKSGFNWSAKKGNGGSSTNNFTAKDIFPAYNRWSPVSSSKIAHASVKGGDDNKDFYNYRVSNCLEVALLGASGSDTKRTLYMKIYELTDGTPAAEYTDSVGFEANSPTVVHCKTLSPSKEYLIHISQKCSGTGGSSSGNSNLYAIAFKAAPTTFSVTYEENGHGEAQTDLTEQKKLPNSLPVLSETGWDFGGWFADDGTFNTSITAGGTLIQDTTLYAKWTLATYDVTLHTNGGTINSGNVTSYTYSVGATLPTDVTQSGEDFLGWYAAYDFSGDRVYAIADNATGNKEFWANWQDEAPKHSITYANYGDADMSAYPTQYAEGIGVEFFADLADTEDEHFTGWSPTSIATTATTDQVITATWEPKKIVTFNSNGGSAVETQKVVKGESASEPAEPTRLNYDFDGWKLGNNDYDFSTAVNNDIELVAQWSRKTISGEIVTENYIADTEHGKEVTSATSYTANSFSLKKIDNGSWSIAKDKSSASSADSKSFEYAFLPGNTSTISYGFELTATKAISNFTVYYTMTDSKFTTDDQSKSGNFTYKINSEDAVESSTTGNKSNKTAYKDIISSISKDDVVKLYSSNNRLAIFALYATYEADPLYVKFTVNGVKTDSVTTTTGEKLGNLFLDGELPTPSVQGYTFNGWKNAAGDAAVDKNTAVGEVSLVLYADLTKDPSTALDNTEDEVKAVKVLRDGQIFIEKNGHVYNVFGACIK